MRDDAARGGAAIETAPRHQKSVPPGELGCYVGGERLRTGNRREVKSPFDGSTVAVVHRAGPSEIEAAIEKAAAAFKDTRSLAAWKKAEILGSIASAIASRREELSRVIALEAGKPLKAARAEVDRAVFTFGVAAEESKRIYGEIVPLDWMPGVEGREAHVRRVPLGPVAGITPFNYPLNLVAHKVAPAMAAGDPIVLRPASQTPISALKLAEIVRESDWPPGAFSVVPSSTQDAAPLVEDERIKMLSFTGSPDVGWALKARAGGKRVTLELGGNAGVIVHRDADVSRAARRIAWGGFSNAGQSCISVQRVYVHADVYKTFLAEFLPLVRELVTGDPMSEETDVGPVIDRAAAQRIESWIKEAVDGGAEVLVGGGREGNLVQPTVLSSLKPEMSVSCREAFAPLVGLYRYTDVLAAVSAVDSSDFGLQAGIFTEDWRVIRAAFDGIDAGGLIVNDVPTFRIDHMPYGGVKRSGAGREGLRYAIEEMSELKLLVLDSRPVTDRAP